MITNATAVEAFIKANSSLRVGKDAVADFFAQLNTLSAAIVKATEANAVKQEGLFIETTRKATAREQVCDT